MTYNETFGGVEGSTPSPDLDQVITPEIMAKHDLMVGSHSECTATYDEGADEDSIHVPFREDFIKCIPVQQIKPSHSRRDNKMAVEIINNVLRMFLEGQTKVVYKITYDTAAAYHIATELLRSRGYYANVNKYEMTCISFFEASLYPPCDV